MRIIAQINVYGSQIECVSPLDLVYFLWEKSYLVKVCPFSHRSAYQMSYWFQNIYEETFEFEFLNYSLPKGIYNSHYDNGVPAMFNSA